MDSIFVHFVVVYLEDIPYNHEQLTVREHVSENLVGVTKNVKNLLKEPRTGIFTVYQVGKMSRNHHLGLLRRPSQLTVVFLSSCPIEYFFQFWCLKPQRLFCLSCEPPQSWHSQAASKPLLSAILGHFEEGEQPRFGDVPSTYPTVTRMILQVYSAWV